MENIKSRENRARKELDKQGFTLQKHNGTADKYHSGNYRILNGHTGNIEAGENFDLTIEEVEAFISE